MATPDILETIVQLAEGTSKRKVSIPPYPWLKLLRHYDADRKLLTPSSQPDPGFIDSTGKPLIRSESFQKKLTDKINEDPYREWLKNPQHKLKVALVDLSEDKKYQPEFAGIRSREIINGVSCSKVAAIYAAHQLRWELTIRSLEDPKPTLRNIFRSWQTPPANLTNQEVPSLSKIFALDPNLDAELSDTVEFQPGFQESLEVIVRGKDSEMNQGASDVIDLVGFPYIASAVWQSGLYDIKRGGGLWLGKNYPCKQGWKTWNLAPIGKLTHAATALSLAIFFTLLAQDRLVSTDDCSRMKKILGEGWRHSYFSNSLTAVNRFDRDNDHIYSKVGLSDGFCHDCGLIERTTSAGKELRYVGVVLTYGGGGKEENAIPYRLIRDLDKFIEDNN